ncbi:hypothetical protein WICPIJ_007515 [Wickerhamomyces pijperi]|uniref:Coenzyme Q-binding protein COQ10 START domain-containing protein n=1 Tax=Wickerhamomyces pijperi TaxID=599730 RepID=A0A9P8Q2B6_WICPI|nr:hypothetical protein WICPIJ_007515 [Wickerhamomyces pijperi]
MIRSTLRFPSQLGCATSHLRRTFVTSRPTFFKNLQDLKTTASSDQTYIISRQLTHPPELFYEVVSDVSRYKEFIPYCTDSFINQRDQETNLPTVAGLRVGFQSFDEEFTCNLKCSKNIIIAESITHSLFQKLYTKWTIIENAKGTTSMVLELRFKFKSLIYNKVSSIFARKVSELVIKAFDDRALALRREERKKELHLE